MGICKGLGEGGRFALFAFRRRREAHSDGGSAERKCRRLSLEVKQMQNGGLGWGSTQLGSA